MISLSDIHSARILIAPHIRTTPVTFDAALGVWIKWENQQVTGSFKPRGALNKMFSLSAEERRRGVIAASAGNHGQGVALAAKTAAAQVTVYVPEATPRIKIEKMLALGAEVIRLPGQFGDAEAEAIRVARAQGKVFVSPYNDPHIVAGAGTMALELLEQCPGAERWLIPTGGGGLPMGMMAGAPVNVIGVQSEASPFLYHEFHHGDMSNVAELPSLADGLAGAVEPGSITIAAIHRAADMWLVTEAQIAEAIAYAHDQHGQVVEGSGAVGIAAALNGRVPKDGHTVVLVTGGNIDPEKHQQICEKYRRQWA
jgi:threonine dehydratase